MTPEIEKIQYSGIEVGSNRDRYLQIFWARVPIIYTNQNPTSTTNHTYTAHYYALQTERLGPMHDELLQKLTLFGQLRPNQRNFALARAHGQSVAVAAIVAGVHRGTPATKWDMDLINAAIQEIREVLAANAALALAPLLPAALTALESIVAAGDMAAIVEVFDRVWGRAGWAAKTS